MDPSIIHTDIYGHLDVSPCFFNIGSCLCQDIEFSHTADGVDSVLVTHSVPFQTGAVVFSGFFYSVNECIFNTRIINIARCLINLILSWCICVMYIGLLFSVSQFSVGGGGFYNDLQWGLLKSGRRRLYNRISRSTFRYKYIQTLIVSKLFRCHLYLI